MKINNLNILGDGYINCISAFYTAQDILNNCNYEFTTGINKLPGEIDSGNWAISYLISMYKYRPKDFILFQYPKISINDNLVTFNELSKLSCYMDKIYPLFSKKESIKNLVIRGLRNSRINYSTSDIKELFHLDGHRFERPLTGAGNEIFRAMSAIAFANDKQIFCFPWLSEMRFNSYHENLTTLLKILEKLEKTVIIPVGISPPYHPRNNTGDGITKR